MSDRIPGSSFSNPIKHRGWLIFLDDCAGTQRMGYAFVHEDYDPTPLYADDGPSDHRHGWARTVEQAKAEIDEAEDAREEELCAAVVRDLAAEFGPGHSNGVVCILVHPNLPEHFGREEWAKWTFRPAEGAFDWAHNRGLIVPSKLSTKWTFTPLGLAVANHFRAEEVQS